MNAMRIRLATPSDLPHLAHIEVEAAKLFPPAVLPPHLASATSQDLLTSCLASSLLWVADHEKCGVVGFIAAERHDDCLHIVEMDVLPSHGRQGIGSRLLHQVGTAATERGCRYVTLTTFAHIPWNAPFYARHGFKEVSAPDAFEHLKCLLEVERANGLAHRVAMIKTARSAGRTYC